jgi:hypothetical protein
MPLFELHRKQPVDRSQRLPRCRLIPPDLVVNASPAAGGNQAAHLDEIGELTVRRGTAGARQADVLGCVHARPGIEQDIDHLALTLVERRSLVAQPEPGLGEHVLDRALGQIAGGRDLLEKPPEPVRDVQRAARAAFEDGVIGLAVSHDLRGKAEESLATALVLTDRHILDRPRQPAVSLVSLNS